MDSKSISNRSTIITDIEGKIDLDSDKESISNTINEPVMETFVINYKLLFNLIKLIF
jgi:hypothetical protein